MSNIKHEYLFYLAGVLTIHATHRDLLLTGYAHVQTHSFFLFVFFLQKVHYLVIMYNFPLKNAYYNLNICTFSQLYLDYLTFNFVP